MKRLIPGLGVALVTLSAFSPPAVASPEWGATEEDGLTIGDSDFFFRPGFEIFAEYNAVFLPEDDESGDDWNHEFLLPRAQIWFDAEYEGARGRVMLESVPSASGGALLGVAGDSVVARMRELWGGYHYEDWVEARAGIIPTLTVPLLEGVWGLRVLSPLGIQQFDLLPPADLGVQVRGNFPKGYGSWGVGAYNGEGYTQRELNRGKTVEASIFLRPLAEVEHGDSLVMVASYINGSRGVGEAKADRIIGGLLWDCSCGRISAGTVATYMMGVADDGDREGLLIESFARGEPIEDWVLAARFAHFMRDLDTSDDTITTYLFSTGYRVVDPLLVFVAAERFVPGSRAETALPGSDRWFVRLGLRAAY